MTHTTPIVALEGPCLAGKTTLGRRLTVELLPMKVTYIPDHAEQVGGGRNLPAPFPRSLAEERDALHEFLRIEAGRMAPLQSTDAELVLVDRSIHTLLAHCAALEHVTGIGYAGLAEGIVARSDAAIWPETVLYLDLPNEEAARRNRGKFPVGSLFTDADFNDGFRSYFSRLAMEGGLERVVWVDATLEPDQVFGSAVQLAQETVQGVQRGRQR